MLRIASRFSFALALSALVALAPARCFAEEATPPIPESELESPSASPSQSTPVSRASLAEPILVPAAVGGALVLAGWATTWIAVMASTPARRCTSVGWEPGYEYLCEPDPHAGDLGLALIPIAGPFLVAGSGRSDAALYVLTGLAQIGGVVTIAIGVPLGVAQRHAVRARASLASGSVVLGLEGTF